MTEPNILYPAIFVFSMLLIGLLLTIWEFSRLQKSTSRSKQEKRGANPGSGGSDARLHKASGFQ